MKQKKMKPVQITEISITFKLIAFLIIAVVSILIYSNSFDCEFQFDDENNICNRSIIKELNNFSDITFWKNVNFRPFALFTFAINYHLDNYDSEGNTSNYQVFGYHVGNLIVHILTGWFVFLLINLIFSMHNNGLKSDTISKDKKFLALFAALIYVAHPIQTQSVTYIVQRMTALAAMFYVISIYIYAKGRINHIKQGLKWDTVLLYIGAIVTGILALLSKQNAATFPLAMLLFELFFIRDKKNRPFKKFLIISFSFLLAIFLTIALTGNLPKETTQISRINYLITQFRAIVKYIQLLFLPIHQNLDYHFYASSTFWGWKEIGSFLLIVLLFITGIKLYKRKRIISFCIFWFFLTLSVESSIFPISGLIYEHRLYLPMVAFSIFLVTIIYILLSTKRKSIMYIIFILIIFSYGWATFNRNKVWQTKYTLWSDVIKKSPNKARPNYNLGNIWHRKGYNDIAIKYYNKAIKQRPDFVEALNNLGNVWNNKGNSEKAMEYYTRVLEIEPNYTRALNNLGVIVARKGELEKAKEYYKRILQIKPSDAEVINNLGIIWARQGEFEKAIACFKKSLKIRPGYANAKRNLKIASSTWKQLKKQ